MNAVSIFNLKENKIPLLPSIQMCVNDRSLVLTISLCTSFHTLFLNSIFSCLLTTSIHPTSFANSLTFLIFLLSFFFMMFSRISLNVSTSSFNTSFFTAVQLNALHVSILSALQRSSASPCVSSFYINEPPSFPCLICIHLHP